MCEINGLFCQISIGLPIQQKTGIGVLVMSSNDLEKEVGIPAAAEAAVDDFEPDPTTIPIWSKNLVLAILCSMCIGLAGQMLNPTLPLYTVEIGFPSRWPASCSQHFPLARCCFVPSPVSWWITSAAGKWCYAVPFWWRSPSFCT